MVILVVVALSLFGLAFFTRRRFGVLGLGLAAGLVLSNEATKTVADFLQYFDFPVEPFSTTSAAKTLLIVAPALALLVAGPKYSEQKIAILGSLMFAVFGTVLLLAPLSMTFPTADGAFQPIISQIALNTSSITAVAVILAVADMMHAQSMRPFGKKSKH